MKRIRSIISLITLLMANTVVFGASTTQDDKGDFHAVIDATAGGSFSSEPHDFTYYSFATKEIVSMTDDQAANSTEWHIAFKRSEIRLNGGVSGPGRVVGINLQDGQDVISAAIFDGIGAADKPEPQDFLSDGPVYAISEWYSYDPVSHTMSAPGNVYEMRTAEDRFAKFVVDSLEGAGREDAGRISFRWVVGEGTDLTGLEGSATVDVSDAAEVFFNLSLGEEVTPTEPSTSTDWDIAFSGYSIRINGGLSGPGEAGALPAFQMGASFEELDTANKSGGHYFADRAGSAFSTDGGEWYSYDSSTHLLSTKNHVYLIDTETGLYKMQILNYYRELEGTPVSGFITFRWRPLDEKVSTIVREVGWGRLKTMVGYSPILPHRHE
jgi:hypothetical protein